MKKKVNSKISQSILIFTDEPLETDQRVLEQIKQYEYVKCIDCSEQSVDKISIYSYFYIGYLLIQMLWFTPFIWLKLYTDYNLKPKGIFNGFKKSVIGLYNALNTAKHIQDVFDLRSLNIVHANDLFCGLIAKHLKRTFDFNFIYDAHEIEFHRNRKNGLFRVVFDILSEKQIIESTDQVIVVNKPIKKLYMNIYRIPESKITIVNNNHFKAYIGYAIGQFNEHITNISIVYVGAAINGRLLERLAMESEKFNIEVNGFFLAKEPKIAREFHWKLGLKNYLSELLELTKSKRLIMWCCTEDICLSYKLSLPNKFFQAIAIGTPVIAYKETYLAEIVLEHNLGYVYNDNNFKEIKDQLKDSREYSKLLESVFVFQKKLFIEKIEL